MAEKTRCEICDRTFKDSEGLAMHNAAKHSENVKKEKKPVNVKKMKGWAIFVIIVIVVVGGIYLLVTSGETLPPTDMVGHVEASPPSHVLKEPMNILVQKRMLEHMDGIEGGRGGAIINYNCKDYVCEEELIENLEAFADKYEHVYVAPFKGMDAKIALTKLSRIDVLEEFDEERIDSFVR